MILLKLNCANCGSTDLDTTVEVGYFECRDCGFCGGIDEGDVEFSEIEVAEGESMIVMCDSTGDCIC